MLVDYSGASMPGRVVPGKSSTLTLGRFSPAQQLFRGIGTNLNSAAWESPLGSLYSMVFVPSGFCRQFTRPIPSGRRTSRGRGSGVHFPSSGVGWVDAGWVVGENPFSASCIINRNTITVPSIIATFVIIPNFLVDILILLS